MRFRSGDSPRHTDRCAPVGFRYHVGHTIDSPSISARTLNARDVPYVEIILFSLAITECYKTKNLNDSQAGCKRPKTRRNTWTKECTAAHGRARLRSTQPPSLLTQSSIASSLRFRSFVLLYIRSIRLPLLEGRTESYLSMASRSSERRSSRRCAGVSIRIAAVIAKPQQREDVPPLQLVRLPGLDHRWRQALAVQRADQVAHSVAALARPDLSGQKRKSLMA